MDFKTFKVLGFTDLTCTVFENHRKCLIQNASEASYVYILSGQKFIKNAKNGQFRQVFENMNFQSNSVTRQVNFDKQKLVKNAKIENSNATSRVIFKQGENA